MMPETLSRSRVGDVDLHERESSTHESIAEDHTRVGEARGVDHEAVYSLAGFVEEVENGSLGIGLKIFNLHAQLGSQGIHGTIDVIQRFGSVDLGLATPEQAEVGTVDECDAHDSSPGF
jgi:hypothetical protein